MKIPQHAHSKNFVKNRIFPDTSNFVANRLFHLYKRPFLLQQNTDANNLLNTKIGTI
jgi:hypothetical protein